MVTFNLQSITLYALNLFNLMQSDYKATLTHFTTVVASHSSPAPLPVRNSTHSFWLHPQSTVNPLADSGSTGPLTTDADVCVVGSGITGVSAALHLSRSLPPGARVVILEAREFCSGATGRNGGHLTAARFLHFSDLLSTSGGDVHEAIKHYALEHHTVNELLKLIADNDWASEVDLVEGGHVDLFETTKMQGVAREDWEGAVGSGMDLGMVEWLGEEEMQKTYGTANPGVRVPGYNLWPLKLVTRIFGLAEQTFKQSGGNLALHTHTPVTAISALPSSAPAFANANETESKPRWTLTTPRGEIQCRAVLHASNAYASHLLPHLARAIVPVRGQVIATRAAVSLDKITKSSWSANEGFEYWFPRPISESESESESEGEKRPLVILGGGRELQEDGLKVDVVGEADDSVVSPVVGRILREFLPGAFPGYYEEDAEPEKEWTGIMGFTALRDPFVGPVLSSAGDGKAFAGQYIAAGFSGHGMPRTYSSAEAVASLIAHELAGKPREEWTVPSWLPKRFLTWNRVDDIQ